LLRFHEKSIIKRYRINENTTLERFRHQIAPRSAPGCFPDFGVMAFLSFFEILFGFMRAFSASREIADCSQIVLLSIDGYFDPRKMPSGRGIGKTHNKIMKHRCQNPLFLMPKTTFRAILFAYFTLFRFLKKVRTSMQKGKPKVVIFDRLFHTFSILEKS